VRVAVDAVVVSWSLKRRGIGAVTGRRCTPGRADVVAARQLATTVDVAFGLIPITPTCLRRSLTLSRELWRLGLEGTTHVGVANANGRIEAHAWVQVGDEVVNDDPETVARYEQLLQARWDALVPILR
jgi:hypothetical protein